MADPQLIIASRCENIIKISMPSYCFNLIPQTASNERPVDVSWEANSFVGNF